METISMKLAVKLGKAAAFRTMPWNMTEAVDGIPNLVVSQGKKDVVNQRLEKDEAALPQPPRKKSDIDHPRQSRFRRHRLRPLRQFPFSVQRTAAATPHRPRLLCFGQPRKLDGSDLRHLNRLCRRRRLRSLGKLNFCVEMTAAASFIRPSSRM